MPPKIAETPILPGAFRYISPLTGGLPRQRARWLAMTARTYKHQFVVLLIWDGRSFPGKAKTPEQSGVFTKEERKNEKDIEEVFVYIVIGSYEEKKGINIKFL